MGFTAAEQAARQLDIMQLQAARIMLNQSICEGYIATQDGVVRIPGRIQLGIELSR